MTPLRLTIARGPFEAPSDVNDDGIWVTLTDWNRTARA